MLDIVTRDGRDTELVLVDLCGCEVLDISKGAQQNKETNLINLSLLSLGWVVEALTSQQKHVPFRNSSLTRILKKPLLGNHNLLLFCAISPSLEHAGFSRRTLQFGGTAVCVSRK
jgi:hypothetical protein